MDAGEVAMTDLFIVAGEASGDQLGDELMRSLPPLQIAGIGGPKMRSRGMEIIYPMEELQVMGFIDVALALPRLLARFRQTVDAILKTNPKLVLTIDYPGFNLRLAQALRRRGYLGKICHYICPSVWAWGKKRIQVMSNTLDLLISVLPFEKPLFAQTSLRVESIPHPLVTKIEPRKDFDPHLIAFFPGSRSKEIERNLPFYERVMERLQKEFPELRYVVSLSQEKYRPLLQGHPLATSEEMKHLKPSLAVAKSGTIALELALQEIPSVITYAITRFDQFLAKHLFKIHLPYYALPNLIAQKPVFPELIGPALTDDALYHEIKNLITDPQARKNCQINCANLRNSLSSGQSSPRELILSLLSD